MKTEDLIADLVSRVEPVRPLPPPGVRLFQWSLVAALSAAAGIVVFGVKPDLGDVLRGPQFAVTGFLAIATAILAAAAALVLAIPGAERSPAMRGGTVSLVGLWLTTLVMAIVRDDQGFTADSPWPVCFIKAAAIGVPSAVVLFAMLRQAASLRLAWTSGLAVAAAVAIGAVAVQIICPINDPAHALLGHTGPVVVLGCAGAGLARRLLRPVI